MIRESSVFGTRIGRGEAQKAGMQICAEHLALVVAVTAPRQLAAWLLAGLDERAFAKGSCYLCETAARAESDARTEAGPAGATCPNHGPPDPLEVQRMNEVLTRIAAGERLLYLDESAALRAALIHRYSIRASNAHVLKLE